MKKLFLVFVLCIITNLVLSGFIFAQGQAHRAMRKAPEPTAAALWEQMKKVDYSKNWRMWPGKGEFYAGKEPHGMLLTTYVNGPALKAIREKKGIMPYGAIVVKENYMPDKTLAAITVMRKVKGYDPGGGDWFWVKYEPDGKVAAEGKVEGCIKCHAQEKDNDYLFTGKLK